MNKTKLIEVMAKRMNTKQSEVKNFIETFQLVVQEEIKEHGVVMLQGFGAFTLWNQTTRPGRNPKTGLPCIIPSRKSVKFKPGKFLLNGLNEAEI